MPQLGKHGGNDFLRVVARLRQSEGSWSTLRYTIRIKKRGFAKRVFIGTRRLVGSRRIHLVARRLSRHFLSHLDTFYQSILCVYTLLLSPLVSDIRTIASWFRFQLAE